MGQKWRLMGDSEEFGILELVEIDQPWFRCTFTANLSWDRIRGLFEAQASAVDAKDDRLMMESITAVRGLNLHLSPIEKGDIISPVMIQIRGDRANFRY
ncbi:hypothetical protein HET69_14515 [Streptomyces sp. CJ_13]|uniref:hypothetical protein n=1 Tax=Streptomyces sp. CJ_13 TaxID=2724943 RepID=UPI001BDD2872|nr:hypothetical protein [Streptomyces sp. CJ_13]MBT1185192.1 hypothetical protein [Streptomyces sp. CJ_13]